MTEQTKDRKKISGAGCLFALIGFAAALFFDQLTKYIAVLNLKDQSPFVLIDGVFELRYLENRQGHSAGAYIYLHIKGFGDEVSQHFAGQEDSTGPDDK